MQSTTFGSLIAAAILALGVELLAAVPETYQVTGPVLEVNDNVIAVQKAKTAEIGRNSNAKFLSANIGRLSFALYEALFIVASARNGKRAEVRRNQLEIINGRRE
jgi:hypothetical protein